MNTEVSKKEGRRRVRFLRVRRERANQSFSQARRTTTSPRVDATTLPDLPNFSRIEVTLDGKSKKPTLRLTRSSSNG